MESLTTTIRFVTLNLSQAANLPTCSSPIILSLLGYFWPKETSRSPRSTSSEELSGSSWKKPPGRKRKFWTGVVRGPDDACRVPAVRATRRVTQDIK
ncbi:hypothetical protein RB195_004125 [Necator americanus]|uniref:Uncharacterized protein n=1 Tax=Necator americanus TaxID=51031 RepID=A0ABR1BKN0_NECAM